MGKSSPSPPNPARIAREQAEANRIDQFTPFGNLVFSGPNRRVATTTLSPDQQAILDFMQQGQMALGQRALGQIGALPEFDVDVSRQAAEQAFFDRTMGLLDPIFTQQERRLNQSLADRGFVQGGEGFTTAMDDFTRGRDRQLADLAQQAVIFGGQQAAQESALRQAEINNILSQFGLAQPQVPQFFAPGGVDVVGPANMQFQAQLAQQQQQQNLLGGLLGLGGTLGAAALLGPAAAPVAGFGLNAVSGFNPLTFTG